MNIFDRIVSWVKQVFSNVPAGNDQEKARFAIRQQEMNLKRLKQNLTELIFQRKKFEKQLEAKQIQHTNLKRDLELAAMQDRDDLALHIMEELEIVGSEVVGTEKNLEMVRSEIENAQRVQKQLAQQIEKSHSQLAILISRSESVAMRESLQAHFSKIQDQIENSQPGVSQIEESILKLEARMEGLHGEDKAWKDELRTLRKERSQNFKVAKLQQLKTQLKSRSLPGRVMVAEPIKTIQ